jgi:hypothetical protein
MRSIKELQSKGIVITAELRANVLSEVADRLDGRKDGVLHEKLSDIVANKYTVIRLKNEAID